MYYQNYYSNYYGYQPVYSEADLLAAFNEGVKSASYMPVQYNAYDLLDMFNAGYSDVIKEAAADIRVNYDAPHISSPSNFTSAAGGLLGAGLGAGLGTLIGGNNLVAQGIGGALGGVAGAVGTHLLQRGRQRAMQRDVADNIALLNANRNATV